MSYIIVGLGNPGTEFEGTRHNTGRDIVAEFAQKNKCEPFALDKKLNALITEGKIGKEKVALVLPETFMNKSGNAVAPLITSEKKAKRLVVVYDDLDLPFGKVKISFNRSSGGHKGLESIIKKIKTEAFVRLRVGISRVTPGGKLKKPIGDKAVGDFIMEKIGKKDESEWQTVKKQALLALADIVELGYEQAMGKVNSR